MRKSLVYLPGLPIEPANDKQQSICATQELSITVPAMLTDAVFLLEPPILWGDYGAVLIAGDYERAPDGTLLLERTGPFVPPIACFGDGVVVVTEAFRMRLEASGLTGLTYRPVVKWRIVEYHWEHWDRTSLAVKEVAESGEPYDYLHPRPHSESAARDMEDLWEACTTQLVHAKAGRQREPWGYDTCIVSPLKEALGIDFFSSIGGTRVFVSKAARDWLTTNAPDWVRFDSVLVRRKKRRE